MSLTDTANTKVSTSFLSKFVLFSLVTGILFIAILYINPYNIFGLNLSIELINVVLSGMLTTALVLLYAVQASISEKQTNLSETQVEIMNAEVVPHISFGSPEFILVGEQTKLTDEDGFPLHDVLFSMHNAGNGKAVEIKMDMVMFSEHEISDEDLNEKNYEDIIKEYVEDIEPSSAVIRKENHNSRYEPREIFNGESKAARNHLNSNKEQVFVGRGLVYYGDINKYTDYFDLNKPERELEEGDRIYSAIIISYEDMIGRNYEHILSKSTCIYDSSYDLVQLVSIEKAMITLA